MKNIDFHISLKMTGGLKRRVIVQPEWRDFLMTNYRVIMEWVHDEKIKYLEKRKIEESAS